MPIEVKINLHMGTMMGCQSRAETALDWSDRTPHFATNNTLQPCDMSREDASRLVDSGRDMLIHLKSTPRPPDYDDLLVETARCFDQGVDLTERDDPSYEEYVHFCASAHALCLERVDYSPTLDKYLASAPLIETLVGWYLNHRGHSSYVADLHVEDQNLDNFWTQLGDVLDEEYRSSERPDLLERGMLATHIDIFSAAISLSSQNVRLEQFWQQCRASVLYMRIDPYNPGEVSLGIASICRVLQIDKIASSPSSGDADADLVKMVDGMAIEIGCLERRALWLRSLAAFYMYRNSSEFDRYWSLYQSNPSDDHLESSLSAAREGLLWTNGTGILPAARFELLLGCATALYESFSINGSPDELEESLALLREALTFPMIPTSQMSPAKDLAATAAADLASMLAENIDTELWLRALLLWRQSVEWTDPGASEVLAQRLFQLGRVASRLYDHSDHGTPEHVSEASDALARAANMTNESPFAVEIHFERAHTLYSRFLKAGQREDINNSIGAGDAAYQLILQTPSMVQNDPYWSSCYVHGFKLTRKIQENIQGNPTEIMTKLKSVIDLFELIIPFPHHHRLKAMDRLGIAYTLISRVQHRAGYSTSICLATLQKSLELHEKTLKETSTPTNDNLAGRAELHVRHSLVGSCYRELSNLVDVENVLCLQYLDSAIDHFRQAKGFGGSSLSRSVNLAKALEDRYNINGEQSDIEECVSLLLDNRSVDPRNPVVGHSKSFFDSATQLIRICREHDMRDKLLPAYKLLFVALRKLSHLGLTSMARQQALVGYSVGHACDAAASALDINDPVAAVEILEEGRSLFFSQLLPTQMDTSPIRALNEELALALDDILGKIKQYYKTTDSKDYKATQFYSEGGFADDIDEVSTDLTTEGIELRRYGTELTRYLEDVRALPGYTDFMKLKPFSRLKEAAQRCPVVYLNISEFRCDALVVGGPNKGQEVLVIPLRNTSWAKVRNISLNMQRIIHLNGREVRGAAAPLDSTDSGVLRDMVRPGGGQVGETPTQTVHNILRQLWDTIVKPVLSALGYLSTGAARAPENLPRICWCPSGPSATFLPLHAAGNYALGEEHWAMTHVISAYTPTLSALLQTLERKFSTTTRDAQMLLISQPASPPSNPLPCVVQERDGILDSMNHAGASDRVTALHDKDGRVETVVARLPSHHILHLACHGKQDLKDPLESAILLHNGRLTIREIIKTPLPSAELVYLSACQTASGDINTPDESLSIAGGFLFAGYRGAVATMWSINDQDGADVARSFYKHLLDRDGALATNSALALHCAIQELRKAKPTIAPTRWIPYLYFGVTG